MNGKASQWTFVCILPSIKISAEQPARAVEPLNGATHKRDDPWFLAAGKQSVAGPVRRIRAGGRRDIPRARGTRGSRENKNPRGPYGGTKATGDNERRAREGKRQGEPARMDEEERERERAGRIGAGAELFRLRHGTTRFRDT